MGLLEKLPARLPVQLSVQLKAVLAAAAIAPGNQARFLQAGLVDDAGMLVTDWETAFKRLSPLLKDEVRSCPGRFLANADDVVYRGKTSGTASLAPFTYFAGDRWNQKRVESRRHSLAWWGFSEQIPMLNLASRLGPVRLQDSSLVGPIDDAFLEDLLQIIKAEPVIVRGYPSRLCEVAVALHRYRFSINADSVVAVISTGECLFEFQKALLNKVFQAPVINEYGCQETGISGMSCPEAGRLHLDGVFVFGKAHNRCLYEIIDGVLLTTDLFNTTMPMTRYHSGDALEIIKMPCPCGRTGVTANVLGRDDEKISLNGEWRYPGKINLPAFPNILNYQIQIGADKRRLWIQPETGTEPDLIPIKTWISDTLGAGDTQVLIEPSLSDSPENTSASNASLNAVSSHIWIEQVTRQAWADWLNQPLPLGNAQAIASVLKAFVAPHHIVLNRLPIAVCKQINALQNSQPDSNIALEAIKIRVLLWGTSLIAQSEESSGREAIALYKAALYRFQEWADRTKVKDFSSLGFDLLAPMLTLDTPAVKVLWPAVKTQIKGCWPNGLKADTFTMHHYLAALDIAGQLTQKRQPAHPWIPALRPLSAILLGDLLRFSHHLSDRIVITWIEMIHVCPNSQPIESTDFLAPDFTTLWQMERRALLNQDSVQTFSYIDQMFDGADSPVQLAQCWLEKGYADLVFERMFDLEEWAAVLKQHVGSLGQSASNPLPWVPILRAIAPKLMKNGQPEMAYDYLMAAAPPNRSLSNFDRQSKTVNSKQSIVQYLNGAIEPR